MIQYNNFLMKREQSRAGSRFAECEKSRLKAKILITLALLLTAVTGAWAGVAPNTVVWNNETWAGWAENVTTHTVGDITITATGSAKAYQHDSSGEPLAMEAGANDAITFTSNGKPFASIVIFTDDELNVAGWTYNSSTWSYEWSGEPTTSVTLSGCDIKADQINFTFGTAEAPITVEPVEGKTNEWTFSMPGSDVVLTPQYAPTAKWATEGDAVLAPTALEGIIAGTTDAIVNAGTVVEGQGTVMYFATTEQLTAEQAAAADGWLSTLPTAANIADDGATVYVWYYIKGTDTPDGQEATAENTFNDSEICAQPLEVIVLSNKFDITFNAANANTIEAGKATVTVGGTAATVTDGKLQGVKMGSEVKVKANTGYKFRKVEVKKAGPAADIVWDGTNVSDLHVEGNYLSYTKEGIKLSGNAEQVQAEWNNSAYLGTPGMEFITMESGGFTFTAPTGKAFTKIEMKAVGDGGWATENLGTGWAYNTGTVTWTGSAASTVKLLKDADMFSGDFISSIAFYLSE